VHLFNLGSTTQIGEGSVTILADVHVDALREAIIAKWKNSKLKDRDADELVVKPTLGGEALTPLTTKLSAINFTSKTMASSMPTWMWPPRPREPQA